MAGEADQGFDGAHRHTAAEHVDPARRLKGGPACPEGAEHGGGDRGQRARRSVEDLQRHRPPVGQRRGEDAVGPVLGDQARYRADQ